MRSVRLSLILVTVVLFGSLAGRLLGQVDRAEAPAAEPPQQTAPTTPSTSDESSQASQVEPVVLGEIRRIESTVLSETRVLNIYLPPSYQQASAKYPVIYLLDGAVDEDYHHTTGLVQFLVMYKLMPESIVVGIANVDRRRDFTHATEDERSLRICPTGGGSEKFRQFLREELQPFVTKHYRTNGQRTLIGQSLGGLLATELFVKDTELFDNYIVVSPSLWWDKMTLIDGMNTFLEEHPQLEKRLYLSLGTEGDEMQDGIDRFRAALKAHASEKLKWHYAPLPEETHATILHRSLYRAFEFLYGETHPGL